MKAATAVQMNLPDGPDRSRPLRLLIAAHSGSQGGAELCLDTLLRNLTPGKYEVSILFPWDGPMASSARALGYHVELWPLHWWMCWDWSVWYFQSLLMGSLPSILRLARYLRRRRIDVVYSNSAVLFEPAFAAWVAGVPHVWHVHEILQAGNVSAAVLPLPLMQRLIGKLSAGVIFESEAGRQALGHLVEQGKGRVIHNCVRFAPDSLRPAREGSRGRLGLSMKQRVVAFLGRFSERKNPLLLVRAMARLPDRSGWRCLFVGEGPLQPELLREIATLGLGETCHVLPFQLDVSDVLSAMDVLVLPSRQESFGLVLAEAAAWGKPVIATHSGGPDEIVLDGVTGFLVPIDDEQALAQRLVDLFSAEVDRHRMGLEARRRAQQAFSPREYARRIEEAVDCMAAAASRRGQRTLSRGTEQCWQTC